MTLQLDVTANGSHAPFFVALAKGYYKAAGLDVTSIIDGTGSPITAQDVANGNYTFGFASADSAAAVISKGAPLKVVADYYQSNPAAILFKANAPIHRPSDLYGKKVGAPPGTTAAQLWKAFMAANQLNAHRITTVGVSFNDQVAALARGQVDALSIFAYGFVPAFNKIGIKTRLFPMSDYGIDDLAGGIVVTDSTLKNHPGWVRGFIQATNLAFVWSQQHPNQAAAVEHRYRPQLAASLASQQLKLALPLLHTKASAKDPLGYMTKVDWQSTVQTAHQFEGMHKVLPLSDYYTNAYLPK